jgi:AhpD family alkylhydroperoxidase
MTRINMLPVEDLDPELREIVPDEAGPRAVGWTRILGHRPEQAKALLRFAAALRPPTRVLPDRLVELVRLRVAFFNQCRGCMSARYPEALADGLTEDLVCSLEKPYEANDLTDAERAAVHYGELLATNHLAIDDSVYENLRLHFSEEQIVELGMQAAFFVGFGRLQATWDVMIETLPDRFQGEGTRTPWAVPV